MNYDQAFSLICQALEKACPSNANKLTRDSHLVKDQIVDSLELMGFLFELEQLLGKRLEEIDETFDDFRVIRLTEILTAY